MIVPHRFERFSQLRENGFRTVSFDVGRNWRRRRSPMRNQIAGSRSKDLRAGRPGRKRNGSVCRRVLTACDALTEN